MKMLVIPADGKPCVKVAKTDDIDSLLRSLQTEVEGYIEAVATTRSDVSLYCNEEGKYDPLPRNANTKAMDAVGLLLSPDDYIAGNLVVTGFDPKTGENLDIQDEVIALVEGALGFTLDRIEVQG